MNSTNKSGFSLVELSICVIIVGLLISAILIGQSLMGSAQIQALTKQIIEYDVAVDSFVTKYSRLPGDSEKVIPAGSTATPNNDRVIDTSASFSASSEFAAFWPALSLTGLLAESASSGHYAVAATSFNSFPYGGTAPNAPKSELGEQSGVIAMGGWGNGTSNTVGNILALNDENYANFYFIANCTGSTAVTTRCTNGIITSDAISIDIKMDDGSATSGQIIGYRVGASPLTSFSGLLTTGMTAYIPNDETPGPSQGNVLIIRMGTKGETLY